MPKNKETLPALRCVGLVRKQRFAELFARARQSEHYWLEAIELCETQKQRMSLAREIAGLAKAAASNANVQGRSREPPAGTSVLKPTDKPATPERSL